jgi:hypothetical protein
MANVQGEDGSDSGLDMFQEPDGFYEPEKEPTYTEHTLLSGETLRIRLVGFNPLWVSVVCPTSKLLKCFAILPEKSSLLLHILRD